MADILTIGGVNCTSYLRWDTLRIEQAGGEFSAVCSFELNDPDNVLTIETRDAVTIVDDSTVPATTLFGGEVVDIQDDLLSLALPGRRLSVTCRDYNILVEEAIIDTLESYSAQPDSAIIDDLFTTYRPDIESVTFVSGIIWPWMDISFLNCTLRQAMAAICAQSGGRWYVDEEMYLHYFTAEGNVAAWFLSDTPDGATSFPYQNLRQKLSAATIVNQVYVVGKEISDWYQDAGSVAAYGERPAIVIDNRLETQAEIDFRGASILAKWAEPRIAYDVTTRKTGLRAGMDVRLVCGAWGLDETLTVRRLTMYWKGGHRFYDLEIGEGIAQALTTGRAWVDRISHVEGTTLILNDTVFDTDAPATPTFDPGNLTSGVDIDADGHQQVYIQTTWGAVADADLSHYEIQISTSNDFSGYTITRTQAAGGDRIERFLPVLGNTTYYAHVRAVDWVGNTSAWSATRSVLTAKDTDAPGQVLGLSAGASRTLIGLSWTANSEGDLAQYEIERADDVMGAPGGFSQIATARLNFYIDQDFTDGEIDDEDTFWYRVRAVDTSGNTGAYSANTDATLSKITGDHIAALTVTADHIAANTITADKLNVAQLSAISADLGTITAGTVTGCTIRTAAAGQRIVLDSVNGIQAYNAAAGQTVSILTSGAGWLGTAGSIAWNTAGVMTIDGGLLVDGTLVATVFSNAIGQPLFNAADGVLLLGPYTSLTTTAWRSTRNQEATISGALVREGGAWIGTRAVKVQVGITNYCTRPRVVDFNLDGLADGWSLAESCNGVITHTAVNQTDLKRGQFQRTQYTGVVADASEYLTYYIDTDAATFAPGDDCTVSVDYKGSVSGVTVYLLIRALNAASASLGTVGTTLTLKAGTVQRTALTYPTLPANTDHMRFEFQHLNIDNGDTIDTYFGAVQIEKAAVATTFCAGNLGSGYAWTGTANASSSTRTVTQANLDAHVGLIADNATQTHRILARMPYDADEDWPRGSGYNYLMATRGAVEATDSIYLTYDEGDDKFSVYINGAERFQSSAQLFNAGDLIDLVLTLDFTADEYYLYVNGVEDGADTTALGAPTLTEWNLGSNCAAAYQAGAGFCEYAVLDRVLTAAEVAALYVNNRPLVDAGAIDLPGIYLLDGRFRLSSSNTGARTEIDVDGIKAYTSAAQSVEINTDGDAFFGSDLSAAATTALAIFANAQTYNGESMGAGDVLLGDNTASKANILWDKSDGILRFRGGTTTQVYIATDGALMAGGGYIKITAAANILFDVSVNNQGLVWRDDFDGGDDDVGYINVDTGYQMNISTGGDNIAGWQDLLFQTRSSSGTTRNPLKIDATNKRVGIYQTSPDGVLHVASTNDTPMLWIEHPSGASAVSFRFENAPTTTQKSGGGGALYINVNGTPAYLNYYTS